MEALNAIVLREQPFICSGESRGQVAGNDVGEAGGRGLREALVGHNGELELDSACNGETFKGF